jgi:hypothetical protein
MKTISLLGIGLLSLVLVVGHARAASSLRIDRAGGWCNDVLWLTIVDSGGTDYGWDIALDAQGNTYLTGLTDGASFPTTPGAFDTTYNGNGDAYIVKFDPTGTIVYATYLGGAMLDQGSKIAVDTAGNAYVVGFTYADDFPTTPGAYDTSFNGDFDGFIAKLNPAGSALVYSTFVGGGAEDFLNTVALDSAGNAVVSGQTTSSGFPTTAGAYDTTYNGSGDGVVVKLNAAASALMYSTFLGGTSIDLPYGLMLDASGDAYLTGQTMSTNFPTTAGAYDPSYNGGQADGFVTKLAASGSSLVYSTYLGGDQFDDGKSIDLDSTGAAYVTGRTESFNFPTTAGAFQPVYNGGRDAFAFKLTPNGSSPSYGTYLGGSFEDETGDIVVDGPGNAYISGWTQSADFPTSLNACDPTQNGDYDAFVVVLPPNASSLLYGTFVGTDTPDYGRAIEIDGLGHAFVGGYTGYIDAFALKLTLAQPPTAVELSRLEGNAGPAGVRPALWPGLALVVLTGAWLLMRRSRLRPSP